MTSEKRKVHRQIYEMPVWIKKSDQPLEQSKIKDLSLLGCAIDPLNTSVQEMDLVDLYFSKPTDESNTNKPYPSISDTTSSNNSSTINSMVSAKVRHVNEEFIGLCFESVGTSILTLLQEHLEKAKYF